MFMSFYVKNKQHTGEFIIQPIRVPEEAGGDLKIGSFQDDVL